MGTLQEFIANMNTNVGGFARPTKYEVWIFPPRAIHKREISDQLTLQCVAIEMPGHDLQSQTRQHASEPEREIVQYHDYEGTIDATFLLSHDLREKSFFEKWQSLAVNKDTHKARYYDDYIGTMYISQLSSEQISYTMKAEEVYPATIGTIEYSADSTDEVAELTVKFAYHQWRNLNVADHSSERQMGSGLEGL